jgi:hypothetical protein
LTELDHLVVAARDLDEGAAWVEAKLGVAMAAGGKHALMGTHNRLLKLDRGRYLEVMAIDPEAPPPARPRWFDLDTPAMRERLAKGPALIHWANRTDDLRAAVRDRADVEIVAFTRGPYRWRMGVPRDGRRPTEGTLIQWDSAHPWDALPETQVSLVAFDPVQAALSATFVTPAGRRSIP